jgi:hypothetical protein
LGGKLIRDAEQLSAADPKNFRARFELCEATAALAAVTRESDTARSEELYLRTLVLNEAVLSADPDDAETAYCQVFNRVGFAWVLRRVGKCGEGLVELDRAVERLQTLTTQGADDVRFREYFGAGAAYAGSASPGDGG